MIYLIFLFGLKNLHNQYQKQIKMPLPKYLTPSPHKKQSFREKNMMKYKSLPKTHPKIGHFGKLLKNFPRYLVKCPLKSHIPMYSTMVLVLHLTYSKRIPSQKPTGMIFFSFNPTLHSSPHPY